MSTAATPTVPPSNMPLITIVTGVAQIALGVGLSLKAHADGMSWKTAAIPAYVGIVFIVLGALATTPTRRKHLMHVAAMLALLGALGGLVRGLPKIIQNAMGSLPPGTKLLPLVWWGQVSMAAIFIVFLIFAIRSFIAAKRWREAHA